MKVREQTSRTTHPTAAICFGNMSGMEAKMPTYEATEAQLALIRRHMPVHVDWPRPGLDLPDVTGLVAEPKAFQASIDVLTRRYAGCGVTRVLACESRGYLVGAPLALALGVPFVAVRKQHKLPGETVTARASQSTFVTGHLEMRKGSVGESDIALIVDDVIASGATLLAIVDLVGELRRDRWCPRGFRTSGQK
jgi:adenine phosphoribosyltransferase